jgi:hypothetical protein
LDGQKAQSSKTAQKDRNSFSAISDGFCKEAYTTGRRGIFRVEQILFQQAFKKPPGSCRYQALRTIEEAGKTVWKKYSFHGRRQTAMEDCHYH